MLKKITISFFICFLSIMQAHAGNPSGGQLTYRHLGNYKFEVKYKIYRDCRGIPVSVTDYTIRCASTTATKKLTSTLVSTEYISPFCSSVTNKCSGSSSGIEENTYMDTLDFNGSESAFKSCCIIQIGVGQCCWNAGVTTGGSGNNFWLYSTLDLCKAATNSSPVFTFKPSFADPINEPLFKSYFAKDTIDNDSLSYHFTDPLQDWSSKTSWTGGYNSKNPFTPYYPVNYNQAQGPKPDQNPPYGIYLDPQTGNLIAMPTNSSEMTIISIAVKEWRKDGSGKYQQIGEIALNHSIAFINGLNHQPVVTQKINHKVCEGQTFILDIPTDDYPFTQPPPASILRNDTITLSWDKGIKNANYTIPSPNVKLPAGKFEWKPATGDSKKNPFMFSAIVMDNDCPWRGVTIKTFILTVYPKINVSTTVKKINNYTYTAGINISNKKYNYVAGKSVISNVSADVRNYYFKSSKSIFSSSENDTIVFKKNGTYIISQSFISETECNSVVINDTIVISNILEVTFGMDALGMYYTDTSICLNQNARMVAKVTNATKPVTYSWKTKAKTQTDTLGYFDQIFSANDTIFVNIKDASGQTNSTYRAVGIFELPEINAGSDVIACPENTIKLKAKNSKPGQTTWVWYKNNKIVSNGDSVTTSDSGNYIVEGTNIYKCTLSDMVKINHYSPIKIDLISGLYCQDKIELTQAEIIKNSNPNLYFDKITWKLLKSLPRTSGGQTNLNDVLSDKDISSAFDYVISFEESKVSLFANRDSLILSATANDTNGCRSIDTIIIALLKKPTLTISKNAVISCLNNSINLDSFGTSVNPYKWIPFYRNGFGTWPSYTPLSSPVIAANYLSKAGNYKVKLQANNESCINIDSVVINMLPLPKPLIGIIKNVSSYRFRDETVNEKSRKWYINDVFFSSDDTMLLSKTFVHLQPIKLEVIDNSGCMNDTTITINTLIGIKTIIKSNIEVYPNPATNIFVLKQTDIWVPSTYEIYDVLGKKVISGITKNKEEMIDLKIIKSGTYYLKYATEEGIISLPFIKSE